MKKLPYGEGTYFAIPLRDGGYGLGMIARVSPKKDGVVLGYFSDKKFSTIPKFEEVEAEVFPHVWRFGDLALMNNEWPLVGQNISFEKNKWKIPMFIRKDPLSKKAWEVKYKDDDITKVEVETITDFSREDLQADSLSGSGSIELKLTKILR